MEIAIAHKGFAWFQIEVTGRAAHGSRPDLGVDAIVKTGPVLVALGALGERLRERRHPLLGPGSVHASLIEGGQDLASYPERCLVSVERRTLPGDTAADVEGELADLLEACRAADPHLVAEAGTLLFREPFEVAADDRVVAAVRNSAARVLGAPPTVGGASFWADSAFIAAAGIPTVLFGPGGEGAHAVEEWVSVRDTAACAAILTDVAAALAG
jgi:acetylornithine deacetylase